MKKFLFAIFTCCLIFVSNFFVSDVALAQEQTLETVVVKITEETSDYQKLQLQITDGEKKDQTITVENGNIPMANFQKYEIGNKLMVAYSKDVDGNDLYLITDFIRRDSLKWLFLLFAGLTVAVAGRRGIMSLAGMGVSFAVIFIYILPKIMSGGNPVFAAITGSIVIIPATFYFSHGLNKKTTIAIAGTLVALVLTGILAGVTVNLAKLSGFASEEASFLQVATRGAVNIQGLLLAGIIIGVLGVLDDITVSQSAIVFQLKKANEKMKFEDLYKRAMDVGQDHIASMVNTLVLVYTGASLPLLLLFIDNPQPFAQVVNYEIIADEIVRTLVGSIGLIFAVPVTTALASWMVTKKDQPNMRSSGLKMNNNPNASMRRPPIK